LSVAIDRPSRSASGAIDCFARTKRAGDDPLDRQHGKLFCQQLSLQAAVGGECRFRLLAGGFAVSNEVEHLAHTKAE
jgi:hypothetical protein